MPIDPDEVVGLLVTGWPWYGVASHWVLDLDRGEFGDLRLWQTYSEVVRLFNFSETEAGMRPRGPAAVRLHLGFEEDDEPPDDELADMEYVVDIELAWDELLESVPFDRRATGAPLVLLPRRSPVPCFDLTLQDLTDALGEPAATYDDLMEWQRDGFFVSATVENGILDEVGISALGLESQPDAARRT